MNPQIGGSSRPGVSGAETGTLDLLMDMEMPVVVRLGRTRLVARDLLDLGSGSVVEFRRAPDDPVEILVNGRVVARGLVMTVQGNYGVRILEIASTEDAPSAGAGPLAREVKEIG